MLHDFEYSIGSGLTQVRIPSGGESDPQLIVNAQARGWLSKTV